MNYPADFTDQMGRTIRLGSRPLRIISIVPSQTELLYDLGLDEQVVGITKFCIHPREWFNTKTRIGGTKAIDIARIISLKPDVVIGNKEENERTQIEELQKHVPVWMSDITTMEDALNMIQGIGQLTSTENRAKEIAENIRNEFSKLKIDPVKQNKAVYLIWRDPWMAAGRDTFIDSMMETLGLENLCKNSGARYPVLTESEITQLAPDHILLSSEPYPFKEKHIAELSAVSGNSKITLVDGEMFSWYGSRLQHSPAYFRSLLKEL